MHVIVKGRVIAEPLVTDAGAVQVPLDTSGRGDVVKLYAYPDKDTGKRTPAMDRLGALKAGADAEVVCEVYYSKKYERIVCRPV